MPQRSAAQDLRAAEELNVTSLCSALGARKETVNTYLDILSRLGIVHRLGAWTASGARKEVRSPKLHFMDTGCATALRGEDAASFGLRADPVCELEKSLPLLKRRWDLYHWRYARAGPVGLASLYPLVVFEFGSDERAIEVNAEMVAGRRRAVVSAVSLSSIATRGSAESIACLGFPPGLTTGARRAAGLSGMALPIAPDGTDERSNWLAESDIIGCNRV